MMCKDSQRYIAVPINGIRITRNSDSASPICKAVSFRTRGLTSALTTFLGKRRLPTLRKLVTVFCFSYKQIANARFTKMINSTIPNPKQKKVLTCGDCPYAQKSRLSKVLYTCSLWGGVVKVSDSSCNSVGDT